MSPDLEIEMLTQRLVGMSNPMKVRRTKKRIKQLKALLNSTKKE